MHVSEATFVVVDTETTGTKADTNRLIEVAAVKVQNGRVVDRMSQLINPGRSVPRYIAHLTGISTAMLFDEPPAADVLPGLLDFLGDAVFVAHNAPFDKRFLDAELARLDRPPLANPVLCSLRLARRLLPGLHSKGLGHVADHYGIRIRHRHRALGDADATAEVLIRFLRHLEFEHGADTVDAVLAFQYKPYHKHKKKGAKHLRAVKASLADLPDRPGVYFMKDRGGATIYIGKAKSLRNRVRSYFSGVEGHAPRTRKLVDAVRAVEWRETGSELGALLLESKLIKEQQPRFNRAQRRYRNRPFIRLDASEPFPRISWTSFLQDDGAEYFGPLGGRKQAEFVVRVLGEFYKLRECDDDTFARGTRCLYASMDRCDAPCEGGAGAGAYAGEVARVRAFLRGQDRSVLDAIEAEMRAAALRLEFERARELRDWLRRLERMLEKQELVAAPVLGHNSVLVLPGVDEGTVQLLCVRFGRHAATVNLALPPDEAAVEALRSALADVFSAEQERPDRYFKEEVDEVRILMHWLYTNRETTRQVTWTPEAGPDAFLADVLAEAAAFVPEAG